MMVVSDLNDTDHGGIDDWREIESGLDPLNGSDDSLYIDTDGDSLLRFVRNPSNKK